MAVATVALLYAAVRRISGPNAGTARRGRLRADPRRGADVPVQQPRRGHGAADDGRRLLRGAGAGARQRQVDRAGRRRARIRVPGQDARRHHGDARDRPDVPDRRADHRRQAGCCTCSASLRRLPGLGGLVRRADPAVARVVAALHRRLDRQQLHEPGARLQRLRPRARQGQQRLSASTRWSARRRTPRSRSTTVTTAASAGSAQLAGSDPAVHRRVRLRDRLAAARGAARAGAGGRLARPRAAHRPGPRGRRSCSASGCWSTGWCSAT